MGRLTAFFLLQRGCDITLFDENAEFPVLRPDVQYPSPSYVAAGMLAPYCEMEYAEPVVVKLGLESFSLWSSILEAMEERVFFQREGSLVVAHQQDKNEFQRLKQMVEKFTAEPVMRHVKGEQLREIEPEINPNIQEGLFFPLEGQVDSRGIMAAMGAYLKKNGAQLHFNAKAVAVSAGSIKTKTGEQTFDCVADCRGMGAKPDLPQLRGVRGEVVRVNAPDVTLGRPVRLMHPRYPLYIVPRPNHDFIIGATSIESEDLSGISLRGALELLSALYSLHSGFSEARITETCTQLRPALKNNAPRIFHSQRLVRANGLYRHGYLSAPRLAWLTAEFIMEQKAASGYEEIYEAQ